MLNESGLHLNEYGTKRLANIFCYNLIKRLDAIYLENLKVSMPNTDRPIVFCPETQNHFRANKTTSRNKINSGNSYPQVQQHRVKNTKNVILGYTTVILGIKLRLWKN